MASLSKTLFWAVFLPLSQILAKSETVVSNTPAIAPAGQLVNGEFILTDAALANLTALGVRNTYLFDFASNSTALKHASAVSRECKTYPGEPTYPDTAVLDVLNLLAGNALWKDVPLASVCYNTWGNYNAEECAYITDQWTNVSLHLPSPSDLMFPLWGGAKCVPPGIATNEPTGDCALGGLPTYVVNATTVAQVQLAVNFARNLNLRLVIKNTGHDFNGRSAGSGALSIWMHSFKDVEFYETYTTSTYSGPAIKIGTAIENKELYAAADEYGVTAVGGMCTTVAAGGGYLPGGGHSPMSSLLGLGADQVLSVDVVTADGRFVTADEDQNTELFWALRGGGAATFGVTTSWTVKVTPKLSSSSVLKFELLSGTNYTSEALWEAIKAWMGNIPNYNAVGNYQYFTIAPVGEELYFLMSSWFAPNMTVEQHQALVDPLLQAWSKLGVTVDATWQQFDSYLPAWEQLVDAEAVGWTTARSASRLIPADNLNDATKLEDTFEVVKGILNNGNGSLVYAGYAITGRPQSQPGSYPDNAVNPAWHSAALHLICGVSWSSNLTLAEVSDLSVDFTNNQLEPLRAVTPGAGAYASEGDILEPNWQQSFYGAENYERLYRFKQETDPYGLFYTRNGVGSENWYVTGQLEGLPTQNGRLCHV